MTASHGCKTYVHSRKGCLRESKNCVDSTVNNSQKSMVESVNLVDENDYDEMDEMMK